MAIKKYKWNRKTEWRYDVEGLRSYAIPSFSYNANEKSERTSMIMTVFNDPKSIYLRSVLADWLEEHGELIEATNQRKFISFLNSNPPKCPKCKCVITFLCKRKDERKNQLYCRQCWHFWKPRKKKTAVTDEPSC